MDRDVLRLNAPFPGICEGRLVELVGWQPIDPKDGFS
jgi:hypothetical protein